MELNDDDILMSVKFEGGCSGYSKGLAQLLVGLDIKTVVEKLKGITCGNKQTSCPDRLAEFLGGCNE